jgi:hypothetical protein
MPEAYLFAGTRKGKPRLDRLAGTMQLEFNAKTPRSKDAKWARQILRMMLTGRVAR